MRIGIDARPLRYEGVGRYVRELIKHLAMIDSHNEYTVYFLSEQSMKEDFINKPNFNNTILPIGIYDLHKQPLLYYRLSKDNLDLFHATSHWLTPFVSPCHIIITVHDTFTKSARNIISYKVLAYGTIVTKIALAVSNSIIAISGFTKKEIIDFYPKASGKISMIYHGIGTEFIPCYESEIYRIKEIYRIRRQYLLYVGSLKAHKNIDRLIEAFSQLSVSLKHKIDLVIAARLESRFSKIISLPVRLGIENNVKFIGYIPTRDLPGLYSGAEAFIMPSVIEFFGLPIVEAMACGVPVIASKGGALPEIGGDAAVYFDPTSIDDIKSTILRVLTDADLKRRLSIMGLKRSKEFSWEVSAKKNLEIYEEINKKR